MRDNLTLDELRDLTGGKIGITDIACPFCGPGRKSPHNRIRKVLRVWDEGEDFVTYCCQRCGASGYARGDGGAAAKKKPRPAPVPATAVKPDEEKAELIRNLWIWSVNAKGTLAETYLRSRHCWIESDNIRFLNQRGRHGPTMIARFGDGLSLTGLHLTRLALDGQGKAGTDKDKIMLGPSKGQPIIVHDNADRGELIIAEGIEDAASWAVATGWSAWAAGSAGRIAAVLAKASDYDKVFLSFDFDDAGLKALEDARAVRPDLMAIEITKIMAPSGEDDANKALIKYGKGAMLDLVLRAKYKAGRLSWRQLQQELERVKA